MDETSPAKSRVSAILRAPLALLAGVRRLLSAVAGLVFRDRFASLDRETQRLGAATVESATYVATELHTLDGRLTRIEEELTALRKLLETRGS